jgi:hypothetical protein
MYHNITETTFVSVCLISNRTKNTRKQERKLNDVFVILWQHIRLVRSRSGHQEHYSPSAVACFLGALNFLFGSTITSVSFKNLNCLNRPTNNIIFRGFLFVCLLSMLNLLTKRFGHFLRKFDSSTKAKCLVLYKRFQLYFWKRLHFTILCNVCYRLKGCQKH